MTSKIDELSDSLDKLNAGKVPPHTSDEDLSDLLEAAALLHRSGLPVVPPEHILSATVQRAAEGLESNKRSRRNPWLYSGILGAAAALMIFVGIHGFPSILEVSNTASKASKSLPAVRNEKPLSGTEQDKKGTPDNHSISTAPAAPSPETASAPVSWEAAPAKEVSRPAPSPVKLEGESRADRTTPQQGQPVMTEKLPTTGTITSLAFKALILPGRKPDSVIQDINAGTIRQIFDPGTAQELIVTQRNQAHADSRSASPSPKKFLRESGKSSPESIKEITKVVLILHGQEVTLEGRQTAQELTELAKKLVPEY